MQENISENNSDKDDSEKDVSDKENVEQSDDNVSNKDIQRLKNYLRSGIWRWYFEYVQGHSY